jgi:uncharacterized membrane protein YfcA
MNYSQLLWVLCVFFAAIAILASTVTFQPDIEWMGIAIPLFLIACSIACAFGASRKKHT